MTRRIPKPDLERAFAAAAAAPLKATFVKLEMPADFLARLNQIIAAFDQTTTDTLTQRLEASP